MTMEEEWPESGAFWQDKRVMVTGGTGFLGSFVVDKLTARGGGDGDAAVGGL